MSKFEELSKLYSALRSREITYMEVSDSWVDIDPGTKTEKDAYQYIYFIMVDEKGEQVQQPVFSPQDELLTKIVVTIEPYGKEKNTQKPVSGYL